MKQGFRQAMAEVHTWAGLTLGWVLFFIFLTGTAGYFDTEIDRWMQPELPPAQPVAATQALELAERHLHEEAANARFWYIGFPVDRNSPYPRGGTGRLTAQNPYLDPVTGRPLETRDTGGGQWLYQTHYRLHYMPRYLTDWIVGVATLFMLVAIITGVIIHKRIFADFFTFRFGKGQRSWLDAHGLMSAMALPFHLMITYSGLLFFASAVMPVVVAAYFGPGDENRRLYLDELNGRTAQIAEASGVAAPLTPLAPLLAQAEARWGEGMVQSIDVRYPGDAQAQVVVRESASRRATRGAETLVFNGVSGEVVETLPAIRSTPNAVNDVFLGLHEGLFAGPVLRGLFFLSGLLGTVMVAAGLVLWTVKRRQQLEKKAQAPHLGLALVERLNAGTVIGLPIAIAAYFWANRLIPVEAANRADWEAHVLFIVWALLLLQAGLRPVLRAWIEQAWLAAAAFGLLPVLNALTTDRHLGASLPSGDWVMAGFDLAMLAFGAIFAVIAWRLTLRVQVQETLADRRDVRHHVVAIKAQVAE